MKQWMITTLLCLVLLQSNAQASEVKQLEANIEKLIQLKLILENMVKGYSILSRGYNTISDLSKGNFNLHKEYLDALVTVSAAVANDKRIPVLVATQARITQEYTSTLQLLTTRNSLSAADLSSIRSQLLDLLDHSVSAIEELYMVISSGKLRMNDAERLAAITVIDLDMNGMLRTIRDIKANAKAIIATGKQNEKDSRTLKSLYGLKN